MRSVEGLAGRPEGLPYVLATFALKGPVKDAFTVRAVRSISRRSEPCSQTMDIYVV